MEYYKEFQATLADIKSSLPEDKYKILNKMILQFCKKAKEFKEAGFDLEMYKETFDFEKGTMLEFFNFLFEIKELINDSAYVFLNDKVQQICKDLKSPNPEKYDQGERYRDFEYMCSISKLFHNYVNAETKLDLLRVPELGTPCANILMDLLKLEYCLRNEYADVEHNHKRMTILFVIKLDFVMHNLRLMKAEENIIPLYTKKIHESLKTDAFFRKILKDSEFDYNIWLNVFEDVKNNRIEIPDETGEEHRRCLCENNNQICYGYNSFRKCKNYERFIHFNPIVEAIYKPIKIKPTSKANKGPCLPDVVILNNKNNLLHLLYSIPNSRHKNIINIALFDLFMRNLQFVKKNKEHLMCICAVLFEEMKEVNFLQLLDEIRFDSSIWEKTFFDCMA